MTNLENLIHWTPAEITRSLNEFLQTVPETEDIWVFAYGSLIWRPDMDYTESSSGTLMGFHRKFCCWSVVYRGTQLAPGLVLALDEGGRCEGVVFKLDPARKRANLQKLWEREMLTGFYTPKIVPIQTPQGDVQAITFIANTWHEQYAHGLPLFDLAKIIATAKGNTGTNLEYLTNTLSHLNQLNIEEPYLNEILGYVQQMA